MGVAAGPNYKSFNVAETYCGEDIAFVINTEIVTPGATSFEIRTTGTCTYIVDWGDDSSETVNASGTTFVKSHNYSVAGEYTVRIKIVSGEFIPRYQVNSNVNLIRKVRGRYNYSFTGSWGNTFYNAGNINEFTVDLSGVTNLASAFRNSGLLMNGFGVNDASEVLGETLFNFKDLSSCTSFESTWQACASLTSFPLLDVSAGINFQRAWDGCNSLTSFSLLDVSSGTDFLASWTNCSGLTSFPQLNMSSGTRFQETWNNCYGLTSFPAIDFSSATNFQEAWYNCRSLTTFPANMFDTTGTLTTVFNAFRECALTAQSIENILVSFDTNGATGLSLGLQDGTNAAKTTWTAAANTAYNNLVTKGWTINHNP